MSVTPEAARSAEFNPNPYDGYHCEVVDRHDGIDVLLVLTGCGRSLQLAQLGRCPHTAEGRGQVEGLQELCRGLARYLNGGGTWATLDAAMQTIQQAFNSNGVEYEVVLPPGWHVLLHMSSEPTTIFANGYRDEAVVVREKESTERMSLQDLPGQFRTADEPVLLEEQLAELAIDP